MSSKLGALSVLNGAQMVLALTFQLVVARFFGTTSETDVYFASLTAFSFLSSVQAFFSELFLQHYCEIRAADNSSAQQFYRATATYSSGFWAGLCGRSSKNMTMIPVNADTRNH